MDEQSESKIVNNLKIALMVIIAVIVAGLVWWQMKSKNAEPTQEVLIPTEEITTVEPETVSPPVEAVDDSVVLSDPELISADEEQESVLQVIEEPTESGSTQPNGEPALANSDEVVQESLAELSAEVLPLVTNEHILRKFVRAVNAMDDGNLVNQYRPFVQPRTPFTAAQRDEDTWSIDDRNYQRYQPYIEAAEALGPEQLVSLYAHYRPMLEEAFNELGTDKKDFNGTLKRALQELIAAPDITQPLALIRPSVMYKYQDKRLEGLSAPSKLMLRIGPENRKRVKALAKAILNELPD